MADHAPEHTVHRSERCAGRDDRQAAQQREHVENNQIEQHAHNGEKHVVLIEKL